MTEKHTDIAKLADELERIIQEERSRYDSYNRRHPDVVTFQQWLSTRDTIAEWAAVRHEGILAALRRVEGMREALELVNQTFRRASASEVNDWMGGDDIHEAWNAARAALADLPAPAKESQ